MKNYLKIIICFIFMLPIITKADMGAPMIKEYKAEVINKDGAEILDYSSYDKTGNKIAYKTIVTVLEEEINTGGINYCNIKEKGLIDCKDIKAVDSLFVSENDYSNDKFITSYVFKDVEIKSGPGLGYESLGTIKSGNYIKIKKIKEADTWYYVEYIGIKGYINSYAGSNYTHEQIDKAMIAMSDIDIIDINTSNKIGSIPVNTIIKKGMYKLDPWAKKYYIEYNGIKGFVSKNFAENKGYTIKLQRKVDVYEKEFSGGKLLTTLEAGTVFDTAFTSEDTQSTTVYYKNGDIEGWITDVLNEENNYESAFEFVKELDNKIQLDEDIEPNNENNREYEEVKPVAKTTIIMIIMGSIIVFLMAFVVILLINKKGAKK